MPVTAPAGPTEGEETKPVETGQKRKAEEEVKPVDVKKDDNEKPEVGAEAKKTKVE